MSYEALKVGFIVHGTLDNLGTNTGALHAYYQCGLPQPAKAAAMSSGAVIMTFTSPWEEYYFQRTREVVIGLSAYDMFSIPWEKKAAALLTAGALMLPLLSRLEPKHLNPFSKFALDLGKTGAGLAVAYYLGQSLKNSKSLYSNQPLSKLLEERIDEKMFRAIKRSKTDVITMATDLRTGEHIGFSSKEQGIDRYDQIVRLMCSTTVPIYCAPASYRGHLFTDGQVASEFPIGQLEDMDVVIDFDYTADEPLDLPEPRTWGDHHHCDWDIRAKRLAPLEKENYENRRAKNPGLPEVVTITSDEPLPRQAMENYRPEAVKRAIELGEEIMLKNQEKVRAALDRAKASKGN